MPYSYYKALQRQETPSQKFRQDLKKKTVKAMPNLLLIIGATAVTTVVYPMLSYRLSSSQWGQAQQPAILQQEAASPSPQVIPSQNDLGVTQPIVVQNIDFTKASNWFPSAKPQNILQKDNSLVNSYTISIPALDVEDMQVIIGGDDLDKHLIHYSGTALPGELGNPVIFGHSVLPVFYNPTSYISVFSTLPTLDEGDEIFIDFDGITYKYQVSSYHEVLPHQVEVLEQRYDRKTLTLITCVPPGTYLKRGVILADLVEY